MSFFFKIAKKLFKNKNNSHAHTHYFSATRIQQVLQEACNRIAGQTSESSSHFILQSLLFVGIPYLGTVIQKLGGKEEGPIVPKKSSDDFCSLFFCVFFICFI